MLMHPEEQTGFTQVATGHAIQPALWPEAGISTEITPYVRLSGAAGNSLARGGVDFNLGGRAVFDGYFNLFNLGKWTRLCGSLPLELLLQGRGRFHLTIYLAAENRSHVRLFSEVVDLGGQLRQPLDLEGRASHRGILYFELTAISEGRLEDFSWDTPAAPRQSPLMILSVTTFRREAAMAATIDRFRAFRSRSGLKDRLAMIVVDNGQSLTLPSEDGITILPNPNLGGAGGFSRGLIEARRAGASHCLFMDDDASVHMGAITRTWMLLAYALDPRIAVAGAMIDGDNLWQIWENGARFDGGCQAQYFGLDTRDRDKVFEMEYQTTEPCPPDHYAGWWFFAFPLAHARHMPFPFFVRGDDVSFSLANDFRMVTLPGVASIQENFTAKASPLTWYLDMRSHLAHHLSLPEKSVSWFRLQRMLAKFYLRTILRFHYDSLSAVNLAIEDVLKGPDFFDENADMAGRRGDLKVMTTAEGWQPVEAAPPLREGNSSRPLRALLLLTLNGHLLPLADRLGTDLVIKGQERENFRKVYGARRIIYLNVSKTACYVVTRDRSRFMRESLRLVKNSLALRKHYENLRRQWQSRYSDMTSVPFWQGKLDLKKDDTAPITTREGI